MSHGAGISFGGAVYDAPVPLFTHDGASVPGEVPCSLEMHSQHPVPFFFRHIEDHPGPEYASYVAEDV
jgi:hypothetical protein